MNERFDDDESTLLAQNDAYNDAWDEGSILGRLMEEGLFDEERYAELEAAIVGAVAEGVDFETFGQIIRIIERLTLMVRRHVDPADHYRIDNLDDDQVAELDRRVRFCLQEVSVGNVPDMSRWEA